MCSENKNSYIDFFFYASCCYEDFYKEIMSFRLEIKGVTWISQQENIKMGFWVVNFILVPLFLLNFHDVTAIIWHVLYSSFKKENFDENPIET